MLQISRKAIKYTSA